MARARNLAKTMRLLRGVPLPWLIGVVLAYLFASAALASLLDRLVGWSGLFRSAVDAWPFSNLWNGLVLAGLFATVVFASLLKAEYRTFAFLTRQNITNVFGSRGPDPKSDFRRRTIVFGLTCAVYVMGAAVAISIAPDTAGFVLYFSLTYALVAATLFRQIRKRDIAALPLLSRVEVAAVIASPWIVIGTVGSLALVNWMF